MDEGLSVFKTPKGTRDYTILVRNVCISIFSHVQYCVILLPGKKRLFPSILRQYRKWLIHEETNLLGTK